MEAFALLPLLYQTLIAFVFGTIIGSFLNVVLYRLHTGKSLSGHSHCLSCGKRLSALELVPLFSYLALRGRCHGCGAKIPPRYFFVEGLTGVLFAAVTLTTSSVSVLLLMLGFVSLLVTIAVYDYRHLIIPDELVLGLVVIAMLGAGYELVLSYDPGAFALDLLIAFFGSLFFYSLWYMSGGRWIGFGDVKLAFPLGLMIGKTYVFSMIVVSFWIGAAIGLSLLALQYLKAKGSRSRGKRALTMKSALPFAPFLIAGFLVTYFFDLNVITLFTYEF